MRILVVEDDLHLGRAISRMLTDQHAVVLVSGLAHAVQALRDCDVLLTDWHLGEESGIDLIGLASVCAPQVRCVLMTAATLDAAAVDKVVAYGCRVLRKPFDAEALAESLRPL